MDINSKALHIFKGFVDDLIKVFPEYKVTLYENYSDILALETLKINENQKIKDFLKKIDSVSTEITDKNECIESEVSSEIEKTNDAYAIAKIAGIKLCESYNRQFGKSHEVDYRSLMPTNLYGPGDNFDPENAMVIPSLIHRATSGERPLKVWGDGSPIRDFIHANDVAEGMIKIIEKGYNKPVNLGSGDGVTIKQIATTIAECMPDKCEIIWDTSKPSGDKKRIMKTERAKSLGINPIISLKEGIKNTIEWYSQYGNNAKERYNAFTDKLYKKN